ncbi:hypothetical protein ACIF6L_24820 [Kitasatospora sp. NPDC086009]|uniref:hypothetical protein n=1 Tax=unclassified Kitasatospora TaxID=2633591 RepID=UPI0037C88F65
MVLHVGAHALRRRRMQLRDSAGRVAEGGDAVTSCLLLFYAAECALKERVLIRKGLRDTSLLEPTHDLWKLAKDLGLPRRLGAALRGMQNCRTAGQSAVNVAIADLHQAWRYGVKLHVEDEKRARDLLDELITWCEQD